MESIFSIPTAITGGPNAVPGLMGRVLGDALNGSDTQQQSNEMLNSIPILGGFFKDLNDIAQEARLQDVGSLVGTGISTVGVGIGLGETAMNGVNMAMENPYSLLYGGLQAGGFGAIPIPGAALMMSMLSDTVMPQTAAWAEQNGYGVTDVDAVQGWRGELAGGTTGEMTGVFGALTDAINGLVQSQSNPQPITVNATIQVSGEELATKGYVQATIQSEVVPVIKSQGSRIVGH